MEKRIPNTCNLKSASPAYRPALLALVRDAAADVPAVDEVRPVEDAWVANKDLS